MAEPVPRFLADVYEAASRCNKCSLCQAVCPTYLTNPVEWETARGRVALVRDAIEGRLELAGHGFPELFVVRAGDKEFGRFKMTGGSFGPSAAASAASGDKTPDSN